MDFSTARTRLRQELTPLYGPGEAAAMTHLLFEALYQTPKADWKQNPPPLTAPQQEQLAIFTQRLLAGEPVQYVLNEAWFYGLKLFVDANVLIPRSETEELVHWIVQEVTARQPAATERQRGEADVTDALKILDIGTGSGCIALALKSQLPRAEVWGCDTSEAALNVARRNGADLDIRVDFQGVDILDTTQQRSLPTVDIIVSNPPYIPLAEAPTLAPHVREQEPHLALFVPDGNPLLFYEAVARFAENRLYPTGSIYLETHEALAQSVSHLFESNSYRVEIRRDMQGKERMVKAFR